MRRKTTIVLVALTVLMLPLAAAQSEVGPGAVSPDSLFYGLDTAWDNAAVSVGLKKASNVAQERAAEAKAMADKGNYDAAQKAADNMASIAKKAKTNETEGLEKAESILREVMNNAPAEAQEGLQTALDNVTRERARIGGAGPGTGQQAGNVTGPAPAPR